MRRGFLISLMILLLGGCSPDADTTECAVGTEACECTSGGACDPGLTCMSNRCVDTAGGSGHAGGSGEPVSPGGSEEPAELVPGCPASSHEALLEERRNASSATEPVDSTCRGRAPTGTGTAISIEPRRSEPTGEGSLVIELEDGRFASIEGQPCTAVTPGLKEPESESAFSSSSYTCEQEFICGCCIVPVRWNQLDDGWWIRFPDGDDCTITRDLYLLRRDAIEREQVAGGGSGSSGECSRDGDCGSRQRCRSGRCQSVQCTNDAHCSGCNRCSGDTCVACLQGPYGCAC